MKLLGTNVIRGMLGTQKAEGVILNTEDVLEAGHTEHIELTNLLGIGGDYGKVGKLPTPGLDIRLHEERNQSI